MMVVKSSPLGTFRLRTDAVSTTDPPARTDDFCTCRRGRESLRWWREGVPMLAAIGPILDDRTACDPATGIYLYDGIGDENGIVAFAWTASPQLVHS